MPIVTLRDLYVAELQDLFDVEQQTIATLPEMAAAATSSDLRDALTDHLAETRVQLQRLELLMRKLDVQPAAAPSEAIRGIITDARRRFAQGERGDVLDAAIIGAAQRVEHHEIASYGCARTYADTLGDADAAALLQQTLDEEGKADHRLSRIAQRGINQSAGEDVRIDTGRERAPLRYLPARGLRDFRYSDFRVTNSRDESLGTLDGFIVDDRTRRPVYFVVDSGGWFVGQRFLVPVGLMQVDESSNVLRADLDREAIHRYPPFNPDAFDATHPAHLARYEDSDEYKPPTWLMTGVWMTEASGFAAVPPRAHLENPTGESYPENELMMARGEPEGRGDAALEPRGEEPPQPSPREENEPRIERYRER
jgi:ferritin-like metal-binding protein YciE